MVQVRLSAGAHSCRQDYRVTLQLFDQYDVQCGMAMGEHLCHSSVVDPGCHGVIMTYAYSDDLDFYTCLGIHQGGIRNMGQLLC